MRSYDGGLTWGEMQLMDEGLVGPAKNPPLVLEDGTILSPSSDENRDWTSHVEISTDNGWTWERKAGIVFKRGTIQPALFPGRDGAIRMVRSAIAWFKPSSPLLPSLSAALPTSGDAHPHGE